MIEGREFSKKFFTVAKIFGVAMEKKKDFVLMEGRFGFLGVVLKV